MTNTAAVKRFAEEHNITIVIVRHLRWLANKAALAGVNTCNTGDSTEENYYGNRFEQVAKECGFTVSWPGLYPVLHKNGHAYHLPE